MRKIRPSNKYYIVSQYARRESKKNLLKKFAAVNTLSLFGEAQNDFFKVNYTEILIVAAYHYERLFPMMTIPSVNISLFQIALKKDLKFLNSVQIEILWMQLEDTLKRTLQYHHFVDDQVKPKVSRGSRAVRRTESGGPDYTW